MAGVNMVLAQNKCERRKCLTHWGDDRIKHGVGVEKVLKKDKNNSLNLFKTAWLLKYLILWNGSGKSTRCFIVSWFSGNHDLGSNRGQLSKTPKALRASISLLKNISILIFISPFTMKLKCFCFLYVKSNSIEICKEKSFLLFSHTSF